MKKIKNKASLKSLVFSDLRFMNYIYGVIAGDGCYCPRGHSGYIAIVSCDKEWIKAIHQKLKLNSSLYFRSQQKYRDRGESRQDVWFLRISNRKFLNKCLSHGLVHRKSHKSKSFMFSDRGYEFYFLRGLFDSDGSCGIYKDRYNLSFCGTEAQMYWVHKILSGKNFRCTKFKHNIWIVIALKYSIRPLSKRLLLAQRYTLKRKSVILDQLSHQPTFAQEKIIEKRNGQRGPRSPDIDFLDWNKIYRYLYVFKNISTRKIARLLNCGKSVVAKKISQCGIMRPKKEKSLGTCLRINKENYFLK